MHISGLITLIWVNLVPRVYSAFKMAAEGGEEVFSALSRHLESGVDPGNEVGSGYYWIDLFLL